MDRKAVFSGTWYPTTREEIEKYIPKVEKKERAIACVCPHAGWMYSGWTAGKVYARLELYDTYVLFGPNHTGLGKDVAIFPSGKWQMPLGSVSIDEEFVEEVTKLSEFITKDAQAHMREHSLEVQIPFIQVLNPNFKMVAITIKLEDYEVCKDIAIAVSDVVKKQKDKRIILIASTDMSHYETYEYAKKQDKLAIDEILKLDPKSLYDVVRKRGISMCGCVPTVTVLYAANLLGAKSAELVEYTTSGDVSGDYSAVVGYAGLIIK